MMDESLKDKAENVQAEMDTLRVLVDAVDSKLRFFIAEESLFGPYTDLIKSYALDIQVLLHVLNDYIWQMNQAQDEIIHILNKKEDIA